MERGIEERREGEEKRKTKSFIKVSSIDTRTHIQIHRHSIDHIMCNHF